MAQEYGKAKKASWRENKEKRREIGIEGREPQRKKQEGPKETEPEADPEMARDREQDQEIKRLKTAWFKFLFQVI